MLTMQHPLQPPSETAYFYKYLTVALSFQMELPLRYLEFEVYFSLSPAAIAPASTHSWHH